MLYPDVEDHTVILSGSCSAMTNRQVAANIKTGAPSFRLDPMKLAGAGADDVLSWLAKQDLGYARAIDTHCVHVTPRKISSRVVQSRDAGHLAQ